MSFRDKRCKAVRLKTIAGLIPTKDFLAGHYRTDTFPAAGTKIQLVYGEAYQEPVEKYDAEQSVVDVFEYCTRHYGALGLVEDGAMTLLQAIKRKYICNSIAGYGYRYISFLRVYCV